MYGVKSPVQVSALPQSQLGLLKSSCLVHISVTARRRNYSRNAIYTTLLHMGGVDYFPELACIFPPPQLHPQGGNDSVESRETLGSSDIARDTLSALARPAYHPPRFEV